jgi:hypothetical protein
VVEHLPGGKKDDAGENSIHGGYKHKILKEKYSKDNPRHI